MELLIKAIQISSVCWTALAMCEQAEHLLEDLFHWVEEMIEEHPIRATAVFFTVILPLYGLGTFLLVGMTVLASLVLLIS